MIVSLMMKISPAAGAFSVIMLLTAAFVGGMVVGTNLDGGAQSDTATTSYSDTPGAVAVTGQDSATSVPEQSTAPVSEPQDDDSSAQASSDGVDANTEAVLAQMRQEEQRRQMEDLAQRGQQAQNRRQAEIDQYNLQYNAQTP